MTSQATMPREMTQFNERHFAKHTAGIETLLKTSRATRSEISQALAKAIAYRDCGKQSAAEEWAIRLVRMLEAEAILRPEVR